MLANIPKLITAYFTERPDPAIAAQRVSFGTSGHRGSSLHSTFNELHILAITAAICEYRKLQGVDGPLFLAKDTHALSEPAFMTALESLAVDGQLMAFHHHGFWQPMDTLRDKTALDELWRAGAAPWKIWS